MGGGVSRPSEEHKSFRDENEQFYNTGLFSNLKDIDNENNSNIYD